VARSGLGLYEDTRRGKGSCLCTPCSESLGTAMFGYTYALPHRHSSNDLLGSDVSDVKGRPTLSSRFLECCPAVPIAVEASRIARHTKPILVPVVGMTYFPPDSFLILARAWLLLQSLLRTTESRLMLDCSKLFATLHRLTGEKVLFTA
jgi:hypothetical protein